MTTATARVRSAALAAGLAGALALALTACGGGSGDDDSSSTAPSASGTPSASTSSPAATGSSGELQGSWISTAGGKIVALVVNGTGAGVFTTGGTMCSGTAGTQDGMQMIHLTCGDGSTDRSTGMVDSVDAATLKVTWSGKAGQETYTKAEGGKLPSGLPTVPVQR
ncbi:hypothetical protein ACF073_20495 [Streptomyces sp. NPDC015171]|uniref:hypothetical protein n=1 Tax=Streptomyces sp. NPDC015171 TaxID=3364945 RepID=UPI0036F8D639